MSQSLPMQNALKNIPVTYQAVVEEICRFTDLAPAEVQQRVWNEALVPGCNIAAEVPVYGVTPHHYDEKMVRLYTEGTGFIYSGLVYWNDPFRQTWSQNAVGRIQQYAERNHFQPQAVRILMLGDGTGNDSLFLANHGFAVDYFDVPGSQTFDFACKRFEQYGVLNRAVRLITNYGQIQLGTYDVVISFEVLEHLPDPPVAIQDIGRFLKPGGIALITEAFAGVTAALPTHLAVNKRYSGRAPWMFLRAGLRLTWYATQPQFKPFEFTKQSGDATTGWWRLLGDKTVLKAYLKARWKNWRD